VRQDGSGTTFAFTKHLDAVNSEWHERYGAATIVDWPGNAMRATGNEGVAARVQRSVGAIGYVGYEFARKLGLKMATIENKHGSFVQPTPASGSAAFRSVPSSQDLRIFIPDPSDSDAYPIVTFSWILLRKHYDDSRKANAIRELFQWSLQDGQTYANDLGYVQLPPDIAGKSLAALSDVRTP
jgi:phosphate transport system substrate-binding protein